MERWRLLHGGKAGTGRVFLLTSDVSTGAVVVPPSFVGRRRELGLAEEMLWQNRLLTITGGPGVGKSRFATFLAARMSAELFGELVLVDFDEAVPESVPAALEAALAQLGKPQALLVLDNCEHVATPLAAEVDALLRSSPDLTVLATSRCGLGVRGERIYPLSPMTTRTVLGKHGPHDADAVRLFARRASRVIPGYAVNPGNRALITRVCDELDGVPLAVELAATWLRFLSLAEIATRLPQDGDLLWARDNLVFARHRTLAASVRWGEQLCSEASRLLCGRLAVFADGFTLAAVEAVCPDEDLAGDQILALVVELVDCSMLVRDIRGERYRVLAPVRHYARARWLPAPDRVAVRSRHADWYLAVLRDAVHGVGRARQAALAAAWAERANVHCALEFLATQPARVAELSELVGVSGFLLLRLLSPEQSRAVLLSAVRCGGEGDTALLLLAAQACLALGDREELAGLVEALARLPEPPRRQLLILRSWLTFLADDQAAALRSVDLAVGAESGAGDPVSALAAIVRSLVLLRVGDIEAAGEGATAALAVTRGLAEPWLTCRALAVVASVHLRRGEVTAALLHARECLGQCEGTQDVVGQALAVELIAWCTAELGNCVRTAALLGVAHRLWSAAGGEPMMGSAAWWSWHETCARRTRARLSPRVYQEAFESGGQYDTEYALQFAAQDELRGVPLPHSEDNVVLTPRQREVAWLVGAGLTNHQIANRLGISHRTAESHVSGIMRKLGFTARAQIGFWVAENSPA